MGPKRSIAVAQTCPTPGDVQANLDEHIRLSKLAAGERADLVVFPELSLTGYELSLAENLAFSENDPRFTPLQEFASAERLILVVGAPVRKGETLHIGAFLIFPNLKTELYTKHHLGAFSKTAACDSCDHETIPPAESTVFLAGESNPLISFGDNLAAIAICADIGRPAHAKSAADRLANLYLASMFVIPSDFPGEVSRLSQYASQYQMMAALSNFGCPSGGLRSAGRSSIWSDTGELLVQLKAQGSGVAVVSESAHGRTIKSFMISE